MAHATNSWQESQSDQDNLAFCELDDSEVEMTDPGTAIEESKDEGTPTAAVADGTDSCEESELPNPLAALRQEIKIFLT